MTAYDNIAIGNSDHYDDLTNIKRKASISGIHSYISSLPSQYNTLLGRYFEEGQELSGGQWQKIAIARALFRDSDIIILDEPTSALDPIAEKDVFENLIKEFTGGVIFVTHRLGIAALADKIIVMDKGEIVEEGSHQELIKKRGFYTKMYEAQSYWYSKAEEVIQDETMA